MGKLASGRRACLKCQVWEAEGGKTYKCSIPGCANNPASQQNPERREEKSKMEHFLMQPLARGCDPFSGKPWRSERERVQELIRRRFFGRYMDFEALLKGIVPETEIPQVILGFAEDITDRLLHQGFND